MQFKTKNMFVALALSASFSAFATPASAPAAVNPADFGAPARIEAAERTIAITPATRSVNVTNGETVAFVVGDKRFAFSFVTYPYTQSVALATLAPAGVDVRDVRVYVAPSPLYQN